MEITNDNHIIEQFDNGDKTQIVENHLFQLEPITLQENYEIDTIALTQEVVELNERKAFIEAVAGYLGDFAVTDTDAMLKEAQKRYSEKGIELKKAVKGWFQKEDVSPSTDQAFRRNLYDFCVAMDMDLNTTAKFFLKAFLTIPFNYKDRDDAIYFYCLKMNKPYSVIKKMLEVADTYTPTNKTVDFTEKIGKDILAISDDAEFLAYLCQNCYDRKHQYSTAKKEITNLVEKNKTMVPGKDNDSFCELGTKKTSALLAAILGYRYQGLDSAQRKYMKECGLPSFPHDGDIDMIVSDENEASFDNLRKTLILMKFYNFYRELQIKNNELYMDDDVINEHLYDFFDETNDMLALCGFVQMYLRNPFDWIILFCANSPNPIEYLQDFIQKRYLGDLE